MITQAQQLGDLLIKYNKKLTTAESCTGGGLAALITEIPGCSHWFERGFVTYSNQSKIDMLAVPQSILNTQGAVSQSVVEYMAQGALTFSQANISIAITGIAGPSGGTPEKPIGTVWIAWANPSQIVSRCYSFNGDRHHIRQQTIKQAIDGLINFKFINLSTV